MVKLTAKHKKFIRENFDTAEEMINTDKLDDVLLPLDALITYKGFDDDYFPNEWGLVAERIYDEIYDLNNDTAQ